MIDYDEVDAEVTNVIDGAGVQDSVLFETSQPITLVYGYLNSGVPITAEVRYFAAMDVYRELDDEEQAMYNGVETLNFSSVLPAGSDGEAEQDDIVNVNDGDVGHAIGAFEQVIEDRDGELTIDMMEVSSRTFAIEDGDVVETTVSEDDG